MILFELIYIMVQWLVVLFVAFVAFCGLFIPFLMLFATLVWGKDDN